MSDLLQEGQSERQSVGEIIRSELDKRGWTQSDLALILGTYQAHVNQIITGKLAISPEMAVALAAALGRSPEFWATLDASYRVSLLESNEEVERRAKILSMAPVKDMERRGWIKKTSAVNELECELRRFYDVNSLDEKPSLTVSTRKTSEEVELSAAQLAWCYRAKRIARTVPANKYNAKNFDAGVAKLKKLIAFPEQVQKVPRVLSEMGIRLVIVEQLPQSQIDGAAFWLDEDSPVIALSVRFDRIDCFWHTLGHEMSHIKHADALSLDDSIFGEARNKVALKKESEARADREAANMLIESEKLRSFIIRMKPYYSKARINQFAHRWAIHPGIVTGQLQHLGEISYSSNREMLAKIRDLATSVITTDGWGKLIPAF